VRKLRGTSTCKAATISALIPTASRSSRGWSQPGGRQRRLPPRRAGIHRDPRTRRDDERRAARRLGDGAARHRRFRQDHPGISFLAAGLAKREPCLHFGFYENPASLLAKPNGWASPSPPRIARPADHRLAAADELYLDELVLGLLDLVKKHKIKRLFLDGAIGLFDAWIPLIVRIRSWRRWPTSCARSRHRHHDEEIGLIDPTAESAARRALHRRREHRAAAQLEIDRRHERTIAVIKMRDATRSRAAPLLYHRDRHAPQAPGAAPSPAGRARTARSAQGNDAGGEEKTILCGRRRNMPCSTRWR